MAATSEYRSLRALLQKSLDTLDSELAACNLPEFQVTKAEFHPTDAPDFIPTQVLYEARRNAVAAMDMLTAAIKETYLAPSEHSWSHYLSIAMQLASRTKVFDMLIPAGPTGVHLTVLSAKTGINDRKLGKLLRLLAANYYLTEVEEGQFAVARRGLLLAPGVPMRDFAAWVTWCSLGCANKCLEVWSDPARTNSCKPLDTPAAVAFDWKAKGSTEVWDWTAKYHPTEIEGFFKATHGIPIHSVTREYNWSSLPDDALIVDVGGGTGQVAIHLLKENPRFRAVIQDRPGVRHAAEQKIREIVPELVKQAGRIEFEDIDFFKTQPRKNADIYILRFILHDLDDDRAATVLRHIAQAMGPHSKLLVIDFVVEPAIVTAEGHTERGISYPLLRSSLSPTLALQTDLEMSACVGGTERTQRDSKALYDRVGLKVNRHIYTRGPFGINELVLP